ncbi:hypothetical protein DVH05_027422 [Phytophthora capsici]|nr:hypothetical protein DVH05_027422 [Phytophthora capsici]|eukprot:jgi/Phyca11/131111/e_gw1.101.36.1
MENNTVSGSVKPSAVATIRIQARLILIKPETTKNGFKILRLYLTDKSSPEPFPEQKKDFFEAETVNTLDAHAAVITLTLFESNLSDPRLPKEGSIIAFNPTKMNLFWQCCQVQAKLGDLCVVSSANEGTGETKTEDND